MELNIYSKNDNLLATVIVGSNSYVFTQIMGDNYLQLEFSHGEYIDIRRDAYVTYQGVKYILTGAVNVEKISTVEYNYSARFEAPQELLENVIMSHMSGEDQNLTKAYERNFSLAGTALEHIMMLWRNTERLGEMFNEPTEANIDPALTGVKVVGYNVVSCKSALQLIANQFETEWWITGNETNGYDIHLGKCSFDENNATKLAYGYDNGVLSGAKRQLHKDAQRMTHIAVQGGSKNINTLSQLTDVNGNPIAPYKFSTLHLPRLSNADENGVGKIYYDVKNNKFYGETGFSMVNAVLLTIDRDANTMTSSLFTDGDVIVEKAYDLSEFYPKKTRSVSTWGFQRNNTEFYVTDNSIENACNYKSYQLGGEKITIEFQSGALAGKSFDVINYDHTNKKFECSLADYDTISMPSVSDDYDMWRPTEGDEFIVFGCALPKTYIADTSTDPFSGAEWDMARRTASILCDNYEDKYAYSLQIDSNWLSRRTESERAKLKCGYWVHFSDNQLAGGGIDIRITDVKQYLTRPLQPELTIGDEVKQVSIAQKLNQIASNVSATYNYVQNVEQETQQAIQQVQQSGGGGEVTITNTLPSTGRRLATINDTDIYAETVLNYTALPTDSISFLGLDKGECYHAPASLLWSWFRTQNNLPYFWAEHGQNSVPSAYRYNPALSVDKTGVYWYNGSKWTSLISSKVGINIQWYYNATSDHYYCSGSDRSQVRMRNYVATGSLSFTLQIEGYEAEDDLIWFMQQHTIAVTMNGYNNGVYSQMNLTALSSMSIVTYSDVKCIKIDLPNTLYYMPDADNDTYIGVSFTPVL